MTSSGPVLTETPEELAYELRAAEGSLWTGTRLCIGIGIFTFASLAFAYFYLRSSDSANLWRPHGITAPTATGAAVMAFGAAGAALAFLAARRFRSDQMVDWQVAGWTASLCGLLAIGLQIWELTQLPFFPGSSGYASTFIGWAVMNIALLFFGVYWSETLVARFMRLRRALSEEGGVLSSAQPAMQLFRIHTESAAAFWIFIAVTEVFFWLLFYVL
ncbi:MAG: hypothetical protein ACYDGN_02085 [Acidimicrobiales bacterium]